MNNRILRARKRGVFCQFGGFTLIELMITIVIIAVLAAVGIPSFTNAVASNRMSNEINAVVASLNLARSEAVKRGQAVFVCPASSPSASTSSCTSTTDWSSGWIVLDTSSAPPPLQISNGVSSGDTLHSDSNLGVRFNQIGYTSDTSTITLHDSKSTQSLYRCIKFAAGSWTIEKGTSCP